MRIFHLAFAISKMTYVVLLSGYFAPGFAPCSPLVTQKPSQFSLPGATIDRSHNSQIRRVLL
ncbi:hypothetical protein CWS02_24985 [Enterobacter sp. EA-1]|nr:hypothetical protein CWS02_24985 [Enterobacter sp. EA-1]